MAKADVTALVSTLANSQSNATAVSDYYDRIVQEHGLQRTSLTNASYVAASADTLTYSVPSDAIRLLGVFYDSRWLYKEDERSAELVDPYWRIHSGEPQVYLKDDEDQRQFDLVPRPSRGGESVGVATPFTTFPRENITAVYTAELTDVQSWEELAVAAEILAREFARESNIQDTTAAKAWRSIAELLFSMIDDAQDQNQ